MKSNIIKKDRHFLYCVQAKSDGLWVRFTPYKYDAARIDDDEVAKQIARKIHGVPVRFNRMTGEIEVN